MSDQQIQNVLVLGATGSAGPAIVEALKTHPQNFNISIVTRPSSLQNTRAIFPDESIKIFAVDYSSPQLSPEIFKQAFENQHAIISATATFTVTQQLAIIDAALASGSIQRFIPSEFGVDSSEVELLKENLPIVLLKTEVVNYLKQHEDKISWSAICCGLFFDWGFTYPGLFAWDLPARTAIIFDGGDIEYEATTIKQLGRSVANSISSTPSPGFFDGTGKGQPMFELTKNKYVYVHSFAPTQNAVLSLLEAEVGENFTVTHVKGKEYAGEAKRRAEKSTPNFVPSRNSDYADGVTELVTAAMYGGQLNQFGKKKGLWNLALDLPEENLENIVKTIVKGV
ncbi:isoflavone reductase family [Trichoderma arundinaceum]|uniref:Isoflavone reductase family n=1 Tax=Trichoderma arundinaceum TaxID=490622 RepID=A0A395NYY4_TRIAR|nr:isoflavone reductase family [Trichoderma arundinaceum]